METNTAPPSDLGPPKNQCSVPLHASRTLTGSGMRMPQDGSAYFKFYPLARTKIYRAPESFEEIDK